MNTNGKTIHIFGSPKGEAIHDGAVPYLWLRFYEYRYLRYFTVASVL